MKGDVWHRWANTSTPWCQPHPRHSRWSKARTHTHTHTHARTHFTRGSDYIHTHATVLQRRAEAVQGPAGEAELASRPHRPFRGGCGLSHPSLGDRSCPPEAILRLLGWMMAFHMSFWPGSHHRLGGSTSASQRPCLLGPKSCKVVLPAGGPGNKGRFEASKALGTASRVAWRSSGQLLGGARPLGPGLPCSEPPDAVGRLWLAGPQARAWVGTGRRGEHRSG